jgi:YjbE family integral membrane protein
MHFLLSAFSIVLIDLLLAGDNALVIAMAVRSLPPRERRIGIVGGAAVAVVLRIGLTVVAARLLEIDYVKLAGGLLILWIAYKVLVDASAEPDSVPAPHRFWQAIWYIVVADLTMSTDNILAIAAASHGNFWLITFGLALSIPFVVMSSNLLSKLMDRYPATIYLGAGLLGKVGGEMVMTDGFIKRTLAPSDAVLYGVEAVLAIFFALLGWRMCSRKR